MGNPRLISKAELARRAGVSRAAVTKLTQTSLADAMYNGKVDCRHPLIIEWLSTHSIMNQDIVEPSIPAIPRTGTVGAVPASDIDPTAGRQSKSNEVSAPPAPLPPLPSIGSTPQIGGVPIEDLEHLTVREVLMRYGSIDGFKRFVESMKNIADYKFRELRVEQQRGTLIERELVAGAIMPIIDVAFARLVSDVPDSAAQLVIARVESGGEDTVTDVQKIIRDANSRALKEAKQSVEKTGILTNG